MRKLETFHSSSKVNEEDEPLGAHLFAIEGERWRFLRNKLSPVFTSGRIKGMFDVISDKGEDFTRALEKASQSDASVEMKLISTRFTTDVISSCAFGMEAGTLNEKNPELMVIHKDIFDSDKGLNQLHQFFLFNYPKLAKRLHLRNFSKRIEDYFCAIVGNNLKHREENNIERNDFLNMLLQLKNKGRIDGDFSSETRKLTLNECIAQAFVFFLAGTGLF